jgi:hypothetical protein
MIGVSVADKDAQEKLADQSLHQLTADWKTVFFMNLLH